MRTHSRHDVDVDAPTSDVNSLEEPPSVEELEYCLEAAWEQVRSEDPPLFLYEREVHSVYFERALCFRFGLALESILADARPNWLERWSDVVVDAELARAGSQVKLDPGESPDLVVHVRGTDDWNLVAIEAKHRSGPSGKDLSKLRRLLSSRQYRYAFAIRLGGPRITIERVEVP